MATRVLLDAAPVLSALLAVNAAAAVALANKDLAVELVAVSLVAEVAANNEEEEEEA